MKAREQWTKNLQSGPIKMSHNGREITPEETLDLWINGYYPPMIQKLRKSSR